MTRAGMPRGFDNGGVTGFDSHDNMFWGMGPEYDETWEGFAIATRDSEILAQSNAATIVKRLKAVDADEAGWTEMSMGHWACGNVDYVLVKDGTAARTEFDCIKAELADYPVLDEEDYSRRCYEDHCYWIKEAAHDLCDTEIDKEQAELVWQALRDDDEDMPEDYYPDSEKLERALRTLGLLYVDPDDEDAEPLPYVPHESQMSFGF